MSERESIPVRGTVLQLGVKALKGSPIGGGPLKDLDPTLDSSAISTLPTIFRRYP